MGERQDRPEVDWAGVQIEFEKHSLTNKAICERFGITPMQLRYRREQFGWVSYRERRIDRPALISRMLKIFDKHLRKLESSNMSNVDNEVKLLAIATKTLEKIIEIRDGEQPAADEKADMADLRDKLAERIDQLKKL